MEKEFVTYKQALAIKELKFDDMCFAFYRSPIIELMRCRNSEPWMGNSVVSAPLKQQIFRWLSIKLDMPDLMIPIDDLAQNTLIDKLILELKSKHLLL